MKSEMLYIFLLSVGAWAALQEEVYDAPYGSEIGAYGYENIDFAGEGNNVPCSFYVNSNDLFVNDIINERMQVVPGMGTKAQVVSKPVWMIHYAGLNDSVLIEGDNLWRFTDGLVLKRLFALEGRKNLDVSYVIRHPQNYTILKTNSETTFYFDSTYTLIPDSLVPDFIEDVGVLYFRGVDVMVSDCFRCIRYHFRRLYQVITGAPLPEKGPHPFSFPDTSEWGTYFTEERAAESMAYLGVDTAFNTYWSTGTHHPRNSEASYKAIFSYDKRGKLRFWFPEPRLQQGWKHYGRGIRISPQGRIFQMVFYSLINKPKDQIDPTKGIRILEYIPEKHDFTHEGRVKHYGAVK